MEAKELRIGNYIDDERTTHVVYGVDNYYIKSYWLKDIDRETLYETKKEYIKPIPLTEEWLLKFGFEKNLKDLSWSLPNRVPLTFYFDGERLSVKFYQGNEKRYVHQLQNLYFALTNEELTIKQVI